MKQKLTLFLLFISIGMSAQLSDGSTAPNFTLDDLGGTSHDLYDYTSQGYSVILDFSATWCGPCWNYHNTGILEDLWDEFGPGGTDQLMVFMIEADPGTSQPCIYGPSGCSGGSIGNWTAGVNYPILNPPPAEASQVNNDFDIAYFPTLYGIAPNNTVYEIGQASFGEWESWVIESFQMLNSTWEINQSDCDLSNIDFMLNEGHGSIDYEWSTGSSNEDLEELEAGDYYLTVTDSNGFEAEFGPIEVENENFAEIELDDLVNVGCNGEETGYLSIEVEGGSGDFEYEWNSGHDEATLEDIPAGDYEVTVTDVNSGCEFEAGYYIEQPDQMYTAYELEPAACDGSYNGAVDFIIDGGVYPFNFIFEDFETNDEYVVLEPGEYEVTIMDYNGCTNYAEFAIEAAEPPTAISSAIGSFNCVTDTVYVTADSSSVGNDIEYNWYDPSDIFMGSGFQIQVDSAGMYTLEVYDEDIDCSAFSTVMVVENFANPIAVANNLGDIDCNNATAMISGEGSSMDSVTVYNWSTTDGIIDSDPSSLDINVSSAGTYQLMVTNQLSGCISYTTAVVMESGTPDIEVTGELEFCEGVNSIICVTEKIDESTEWFIDGNLVSQDACVTVSESSNITVTLTNDNSGCSSNELVQTTVFESPEVDLAGDLSLCDGSNTTLCVTLENNESVEWYIDGQSNGNSPCITLDYNASIDVELTNELGCVTMDNVEVTINDNPIISIDTPIELDCNMPSTTLNLNVDNTNYTISWFDDQNNLIATTEDIVVTQIGTYEVVVVSPTGCETVNNIAVTGNLDELPTAVFNYQNVNYDFQFVDESLGTIVDRLWDFGDGNNSAETNPSHSFANPGFYDVCLSTSNDCGSNVTCTTVLATSAMQISSVINNVTCFGASDGGILANVFGGVPGYTYEWENESGVITTGNPVLGLSPGSYTLKVTDSAGDIIEDEFTISEPNELMVQAEIINTIDGASDGVINLSVFGGTGSYTVEWSNGSIGFVIEQLPAGDYVAVITDEMGCQITQTYTVESSVNVNEIEFLNSFSVSPNPAQSVVRVQLEMDEKQKMQVSLISILGQLHHTEFYNTSSVDAIIELNNIPSGVYLVEIRTGDKIALKKLVVNN